MLCAAFNYTSYHDRKIRPFQVKLPKIRRPVNCAITVFSLVLPSYFLFKKKLNRRGTCKDIISVPKTVKSFQLGKKN